MTADRENGLHAVILKLLPKAPATIRVGAGRQVHAAFLSMMKEVDPELSTELHRSGVTYRPFTISPLQGGKHLPGGGLSLSPDRVCSLRITFFSSPFYRRFADYLVNSRRAPMLRLGRAKLSVVEMIGSPDPSSRSGYTTWSRLLEETCIKEDIVLGFDSPTVFRRGDLDLPLPLPNLVFASYLAKWQVFSPIPLERSLSDGDFFIRHVGIKEHHISTVPFYDGRGIVLGFVGRVRFFISDLPKNLIRQVNALADFSFYAGTGRKTTHGMGQTRRL